MKLTKAIFLAALLALSTAIHAGWVEDTIDFNHPVPFTFVATPCNSAIDNGWPDGSHDGTHLVAPAPNTRSRASPFVGLLYSSPPKTMAPNAKLLFKKDMGI
jgi:hypothetical protein